MVTLKEAVENAQEALRALRKAERELGWYLASRKLGELAWLLDDEGEVDDNL